VENPSIQSRMVSQLLNIDEELARRIAGSIGLKEMPAPAKAARPTNRGLPPSAALSVIRNGPKTFEGRKIGILVCDGADAAVLKALKKAAEKGTNVVEIVAEFVSGVTLSDGSHLPADKNVERGTSALYDAVVLLFGAEGHASLEARFRARDFVADAFAHFKFIGFNSVAQPFLTRVGAELDEGCIQLNSADDVAPFLQSLVNLRCWTRELKVEGKRKFGQFDVSSAPHGAHASALHDRADASAPHGAHASALHDRADASAAQHSDASVSEHAAERDFSADSDSHVTFHQDKPRS